MNNDLSQLEEKIKYSFKDRSLLIEALTHSSYAKQEKKAGKFNERMEFLGDAVVSIVSAEFLYNRFPDMPEGELSKLRSSLVCTASLSEFAKEISLGDFIFLGKGEENMKGRERPSTLENTFEALTAAIYLDGGLENARSFVTGFLEKSINTHHICFKDYKTLLQEIIQQNQGEVLNYLITGESGPDHDKRFEAEVHLNSNVIGKGTGRSKKQAEQEAAKEALQLMGYEKE